MFTRARPCRITPSLDRFLNSRRRDAAWLRPPPPKLQYDTVRFLDRTMDIETMRNMACVASGDNDAQLYCTGAIDTVIVPPLSRTLSPHFISLTLVDLRLAHLAMFQGHSLFSSYDRIAMVTLI